MHTLKREPRFIHFAYNNKKLNQYSGETESTHRKTEMTMLLNYLITTDTKTNNLAFEQHNKNLRKSIAHPFVSASKRQSVGCRVFIHLGLLHLPLFLPRARTLAFSLAPPCECCAFFCSIGRLPHPRSLALCAFRSLYPLLQHARYSFAISCVSFDFHFK